MNSLLKVIAVTALFAVATLTAFSAEPKLGPDVPEEASDEIKRLGHIVQEMGTIQAGPEAAVIQAAATPEDDSDRWWVSLILPGKDAKSEEKANAALLIKHFAEGKFKQWAVPGDPPINAPKRWGHYQEKTADSAIQQDWLRPVKPFFEKNGYPGLVIQPPRNGAFGPNARIVVCLGGYTGDHEAWNQVISDRVKAYSQKHHFEEVIRAQASGSDTPSPGGHAQDSTSAGARGPNRIQQPDPPFDPPVKSPPAAYPPDEAIEHLLPERAKPKPLTIKQIQELCPGAPGAFLREQHAKKLTDPDEVSLAWLEFQEQREQAEKDKADKAKKNIPEMPACVLPALTVEQIHAIVPDASDEFVKKMHDGKLSTREEVLSVWDAFVRESKRYWALLSNRRMQADLDTESDEVNSTTENPTLPLPGPAKPGQSPLSPSTDTTQTNLNWSLGDVAGIVALAALMIVLVWWSQKRAKSTDATGAMWGGGMGAGIPASRQPPTNSPSSSTSSTRNMQSE